jgi:hypothetical protein
MEGSTEYSPTHVAAAFTVTFKTPGSTMHQLLGQVSGLLLVLLLSAVGWAETTAVRDQTKLSSGEGWMPLFDGKSLDGWYVCLNKHKLNEDPDKVFQVEDGVIHIYKDQPQGSAVAIGYIGTKSEYANYHLRLQYKWGEKRFRPRTELRRDTGLLYHVTPPDVVWPRSIECQIQENDVGDCFLVRGAQAVTDIEMADVETPMGLKKIPRYKPASAGGRTQTIGDGALARVIKSETHEHDGWNTVEVIVRGSDSAEHIVNGHIVFRATNLKQLSPEKTWQPLAHGRIILQAEYAEVFYRNIEIKPIADAPLTHP